MIRFRITSEALTDVFSPSRNPNFGMKCIEGLPSPMDIILKSVELSPTGIIEFLFDDGKEELIDAPVTFQASYQESV